MFIYNIYLYVYMRTVHVNVKRVQHALWMPRNVVPVDCRAYGYLVFLRNAKNLSRYVL